MVRLTNNFEIDLNYQYDNGIIDLVMEKNGKTMVIQVGRALQGGKPVAREVKAINDLKLLPMEKFNHVFFFQY
jgi:Holliday junction resolvase-like predicted endonuclease